VVLSTYSTVAAEVPTPITSTPVKGKKVKSTAGPLSTVKWKRIVADEGHVLKNPRTKSRFCYSVTMKLMCSNAGFCCATG
jgi:SWI/SNF-related matrix-associated actin-dependent regulator of chromatin subfamily A3